MTETQILETTGALVTVDAAELRLLTDLADTLVDEWTLEVRDGQLISRYMDPAHVGLVDIVLPVQAEGDWPRTGVRVAELRSLLRALQAETIDLRPHSVDGLLYSGGDLSGALRCCEANQIECPIPKSAYTARATLAAADLLSYTARLDAEHVTLRGAGTLELAASGDAGRRRIATPVALERGLYHLEQATPDLQADARLAAEDPDCSATYSLEYLEPVLKVAKAHPLPPREGKKKQPREVLLEWSRAKPLRVTVGSARFYLAPRIEG